MQAKRARKIWFALLALGGLLVAVWLIILFAGDSAAWKAELENQLGREIEFESVQLRFFPRPALVAHRFVLHEQSKFGPEPFLYARDMECQLPPSVIWSGVKGCSRVWLFEPSFNLTRGESGDWNLGFAALDPSSADGVSSPISLPPVTVIGGRVNFKQGLRKLRFALTDLRMELVPDESGKWNLELRAAPFRTDVAIERAGEFHVAGVIERSDSGDPSFRLQAEWPGGSVTDWIAMVRGTDSPLRGVADLDLRMEGTPRRWEGKGNLTVRDLRGQKVLARRGIPVWESTLGVGYDSAARTLLIPELSLHSGASEIIGAGSVRDPFGSFDWSLDFTSQSFDLEALFGQVSALSAAFPEQTRLVGSTAFEFHGESDRSSWNGRLSSPDVIAFEFEGNSGEIGGLDVMMRQGRARTETANLRFASGGLLTAEAAVDFSRDNAPYSIRLRSPGIAYEELEQTAAALGWHFPTRGLLHGQTQMDMTFQGQSFSPLPPRWRGTLDLSDGSLHAAELFAPLAIPVAHMEWNRDSVTLSPVEVVVGQSTVRVTLSRRFDASFWNLKAAADRLDLSDIHLLLHGEGESLLTQLVGGKRDYEIPWRDLWVQATVNVEEFLLGDVRLTRLDAHGDFRLNRLDLTRLRFRIARGRFAGNLRADFLERIPAYRLAGNVRRLRLGEFLSAATSSEPVLSGLLGAEILLESSGDEMDQILENLSGAVVGGVRDGHYTGISLLPALAGAAEGFATPEAGTGTRGTDFQSLSGSLQFGGRRLESEDLRLIVGGAAIELTGGARFDGELDFRLLGRILRIAGQSPSAVQEKIFDQPFQLSGPFSAPRIAAVED